jgi:hypothetical protein
VSIFSYTKNSSRPILLPSSRNGNPNCWSSADIGNQTLHIILIKSLINRTREKKQKIYCRSVHWLLMFQSGAIAEALNSKPHTSSVGIYISILSHRSHCCCAAALVQDRNKIIMLYRDISFSFFYNFKYKNKSARAS